MNKLSLMRTLMKKTAVRPSVRITGDTPLSFTTSSPDLLELSVRGSDDFGVNEELIYSVNKTGFYSAGDGGYILPFRITGKNLMGPAEAKTRALSALTGKANVTVNETASGFSFYVNNSRFYNWITYKTLGFKRETCYTLHFKVKVNEVKPSNFATGIVVGYEDGEVSRVYSSGPSTGGNVVDVTYRSTMGNTIVFIAFAKPPTSSVEIILDDFCIYEGRGELQTGYSGSGGNIAIDAPLICISGGEADTIDIKNAKIYRKVGRIEYDAEREFELYGDYDPPMYRFPVANAGEGRVESENFENVSSFEELEEETYACYSKDGYIYIHTDSDIEDCEDIYEWWDYLCCDILFPYENAVETPVTVPSFTLNNGYNQFLIGGNSVEASIKYYT